MKKFIVGILVVVSFMVVAPFAMAKTVAKPVAKKAAVKIVRKRRPTAECEDGTSIYTLQRKGACALHGGVMQWF